MEEIKILWWRHLIERVFLLKCWNAGSHGFVDHTEPCHVTVLNVSREHCFWPLAISLTTMHTLSQSKQQHILSLLDAGHSASHIASTTGYSLSTISRLCTKYRLQLSKSWRSSYKAFPCQSPPCHPSHQLQEGRDSHSNCKIPLYHH